MNIDLFTVGPFAENTYLLTRDGQGVVADPGFFDPSEFNAFQQELDKRGAELTAVILTHAHVDHILGLAKVLEQYDVPVYLSDRDRYLWNNFAPQARMFGFNVNGFEFQPRLIPEGKNWEVGPFQFEVRYTPGHAPDHVVFYSAGNSLVIGGDTLFRQGIGRTDLYRGDFQTLEHSIRDQLYTLPDETRVLPGHGPETTISYEKKHNPFVRG